MVDNTEVRILGCRVEVAVLEHHTVPVLALQHLVIPIDDSCQNAYLIVSGATDGSIAVWDITNLIITFTKNMVSGEASLTSNAGTQLRPRTGRGSQGGRRFRWAKQRQAGMSKEKKVRENATVVEGAVDVVSPKEDVNVNENLEITVSAEAAGAASQADVSEAPGSLPYQSSVLLPLCTFAAAHQSGVNCLSAAKVAGKHGSEVVVVSGGDDQRIHVLRFEIHPCEGSKHRKCEPSGGGVSVTEDSQGLLQFHLINVLLIISHASKCLCRKTLTVGTAAAQEENSTPHVQLSHNSVSRTSLEGAHSSAVKGEHH